MINPELKPQVFSKEEYDKALARWIVLLDGIAPGSPLRAPLERLVAGGEEGFKKAIAEYNEWIKK